MKEILKNIWMWSNFSSEKNYNFNGFIISDGQEKVIIDPVSLNESGFKELQALGPFKAIYLTNKDHERDCWNLRKKLGIPVLCHKKDASFLKEKPDDTFSEGSSLKCGIEVFHFLDQKSPGECGFYIREKKVLLLGDALIGDPPGKIRLLPDAKYKDVGKAKAGLTRLRALSFDALLLGDGECLLAKPHDRLEQFFLICDKYPQQVK